MTNRLTALFLIVTVPALARGPDGTLALIRTPNNGVPVIVAPGGGFEAVLTEQASLRLVGNQGARDLTVSWEELPGGAAKARCALETDIPPGTYALEATANGVTDRVLRCVFVRPSFPEYYLIAQLTDTHLGAERNGRPAADIFRDAIKAVNESPAVFAIITGDLTDSGDPGQFQQLLEVLDTCRAPTFVCPGNHDRGGGRYERFFGPTTYVFRFGEDGYLGFDTKDFVTADDLSAQDADLEVDRRAIKSARWAIGFTHRYESNMGMRSQIVLFVDNPLDHLILGHWHRANTEQEKTVPWGTTPITVTPATVDGYVRIFEISAKSVKGREPQRVTAAE
jgi:predicted phosphodiesterase